ncbi:hypothetical protein DPMN_038935 [Dreissena polymorpha]|uniref:Uncharacterized protein n=1 Tax=Dreissena polymorpha TaxID=45954 RepID=A0A9D4MDP4_DREPO|nr:hypothetical protein DPMN_038935 [Dreissena polymorpha]
MYVSSPHQPRSIVKPSVGYVSTPLTPPRPTPKPRAIYVIPHLAPIPLNHPTPSRYGSVLFTSPLKPPSPEQDRYGSNAQTVSLASGPKMWTMITQQSQQQTQQQRRTNPRPGMLPWCKY